MLSNSCYTLHSWRQITLLFNQYSRPFLQCLRTSPRATPLRLLLLLLLFSFQWKMRLQGWFVFLLIDFTLHLFLLPVLNDNNKQSEARWQHLWPSKWLETSLALWKVKYAAKSLYVYAIKRALKLCMKAEWKLLNWRRDEKLQKLKNESDFHESYASLQEFQVRSWMIKVRKALSIQPRDSSLLRSLARSSALWEENDKLCYGIMTAVG